MDRKWDDKDPRSTHIDQLILEMIILDCQPFSVVLDKGFQNLIHGLKSQYRLKSDRFFREKLDGFYCEVVQKLKDRLQALIWISCSTDCWSKDQGT